jgi:hypothetical protein
MTAEAQPPGQGMVTVRCSPQARRRYAGSALLSRPRVPTRSGRPQPLQPGPGTGRLRREASSRPARGLEARAFDVVSCRPGHQMAVTAEDAWHKHVLTTPPAGWPRAHCVLLRSDGCAY